MYIYQYLAQFKAFKNWIQHFLISGEDINLETQG